MKKLLLLISFVALSTIGFTQNKGDKYIVTAANASFGNLSSEITVGYQSVSSEIPISTNICIGGGFGYFVENNLRIELCLSGYTESNPTENLDKEWLKDEYNGFSVNPKLSYFVKLAEDFYYTPEIGLSIGWGKYSEQSINQTTNYNYNDYAFFINLLSFQCRVSHNFALGIVVGDVSFLSRDYNINANTNDGQYNVNQFIYNVNQFKVNLNSGGIFANIYF